MIADVEQFEAWQHLQGEGDYRWRSGIKHDAASIMELKSLQEHYVNKLGELVDLEDAYLYPMLKSSEIARQDEPTPTRWMLVPQHYIAEDTLPIRSIAPKTWAYLRRHAAAFDRRKSSIYQNRPQFSIFGVGEYTFSPWKVAVSGLYKRLHFVAIGPYASKPVVLDDTCYFIPCESQDKAYFLEALLNSEIARQFFSAFVFWDAKRPITIDILNRLDLSALACELGIADRMAAFVPTGNQRATLVTQLPMWESAHCL